jgi:hypothetical protein
MRALCAALLALSPGAALAHAFSAGADGYGQFTEGAGVALNTPAILICLVPLGLLWGLGGRARVLAAWPWLLAGLVAGGLAAPSIGEGVVLAAVGLGAVLSILAALAPQADSLAIRALSALAGATAAAVALEGHPWGDLPLLILLGVALGLHLAVLAPAALASASQERWGRPWIQLGWRVAASWAAATAIIYGAFLWRGIA